MKREDLNITDAAGGAAFTIRVVTRASRVEFAGIQEDGILKVRLTGSANDGSANVELLTFLSEKLQVPMDRIEIVAGENSRDKLVSIEGVNPNEVEEKLQALNTSAE